MTLQVNLLSRESPPASRLNEGYNELTDIANVRVASGWTDFVETAENDDIEVVVWKRPQLTSLNYRSDRTKSDFEILTGDSQNILTGFRDMFTASGWSPKLFNFVEQDIRGFLSAFESKLSGLQYRLKLLTISDDACRKFHQDRTFQRLIVTYRGHGTVWRHTAEAFDYKSVEMECVLLRGKRDGRDPQILHRSPIFTPGHDPRLVMVVDVIPNL